MSNASKKFKSSGSLKQSRLRRFYQKTQGFCEARFQLERPETLVAGLCQPCADEVVSLDRALVEGICKEVARKDACQQILSFVHCDSVLVQEHR